MLPDRKIFHVRLIFYPVFSKAPGRTGCSAPVRSDSFQIRLAGRGGQSPADQTVIHSVSILCTDSFSSIRRLTAATGLSIKRRFITCNGTDRTLTSSPCAAILRSVFLLPSSLRRPFHRALASSRLPSLIVRIGTSHPPLFTPLYVTFPESRKSTLSSL